MSTFLSKKIPIPQFESVAHWLKKMELYPGLYPYNRRAERPFSTESTGFASDILYELGQIENVSSEFRDRHVSALQRLQDPSGRFFDPLIGQHDIGDGAWDKIHDHMTGVCAQALANWGAPTRYDAHSQPLYDIANLDPVKWIRSLDHRKVPWGRCSNIAFSLLNYRIRRGLIKQTDEKADKCYQMIEHEVCGEDGLPGPDEPRLGRRLAGCYMLTFCYLPFNRPLPNPAAMIDLALRAQIETGEIGEGGMCQNYDTLYVLNHACRQVDWSHRHDEVCLLADRLGQFILSAHYKSDGAFSFHPAHCMTHHNGVYVSQPSEESDMHGTIFAVGLLNIVQRLQEQYYHSTFIDAWLRQDAPPHGAD